jgi:hypothetical protein
MNRTIHLFTHVATLATIVLGLMLVTAGQAAAQYPHPDAGGSRGGGGGVTYEGTIPAPMQSVTETSVGTLQWVLFAAAVLGAVAIGAALMHLAQRRRAQLAH